MNRATAEVQKTLAEEEGFAPILTWVEALIDDILASEFDADLEFARTPTETIGPLAQEQMLSSYTSQGILTLNEARAVLGRAPLGDFADTPMALTAAGYVPLVGAALPAPPEATPPQGPPREKVDRALGTDERPLTSTRSRRPNLIRAG
jgi:hypothetical protein